MYPNVVSRVFERSRDPASVNTVDSRKELRSEEESMTRKLAYWISTAIAAVMLLMALSYLTGSEQVVSGFEKAGYPQHLRIALGIAKPLAAVVLLIPGLPLLKEWAYAGVTITWVMASISAYLTAESATWLLPVALLVLLFVSHVTRPASRRVTA
jgi:hypothetical protein